MSTSHTKLVGSHSGTRLAPSRTQDPAFIEIENWRRTFVAGHRQRLRDLGHDDAGVEREMAPILILAENMAAKMREDYLSRRG